MKNLRIYDTKIKVNKGFYQDKVGDYLGENFGSYLIRIKEDCIVFPKCTYSKYLEVIE